MAKKKSHFWPGFFIGLLAALLIVALVILFVPRFRPLVGLKGTVTEQETTTNTASTSTPATPANTTKTPVTDDVPVTSSENITVTAPVPGETVASPLVVRGEARVFENAVSVRLRSSDGTILAETFTTADAPDVGQFGPFEVRLTFSEPTTTTGTLEVFSQSPKDGSEINKVTIPVEF
jgi:hypothetical protein